MQKTFIPDSNNIYKQSANAEEADTGPPHPVSADPW